ncbi:cupin domain-containing protein [Shewanella mangrovi]|uniref:cupin domain-containing protein n=1 Tax=Shewanella mangrovi TaxID=1515746 RepID=UPI000568AEF2|nr:cupin domain-containing protein [Shewanella mangrovi]
MTQQRLNLLDALPPFLAAEQFDTLINHPQLRIERILSHGQQTPAGQWYDQAEHEWILLLQGAARIQYADNSEVALTVGDSLLLPAGCRHRVSWTTPAEITVWLAVFYPADVNTKTDRKET